MSYNFYDFCINIKLTFEESEWQRRNLTKWQIINISDVVAVSQNQDLSLFECLSKMCFDMNIIQRELDFAFYHSTHLRENIIRICRSYFALTNDPNKASINVSDLINSLHTSITNYEAIQKSIQSEAYLQQNCSDQSKNDQYFIDRQYRRERYSNRRDEFRDSGRFRTSRSKKCLCAKNSIVDQVIICKRSETSRKSNI
jgi:hypothetical protein